MTPLTVSLEIPNAARWLISLTTLVYRLLFTVYLANSVHTAGWSHNLSCNRGLIIHMRTDVSTGMRVYCADKWHVSWLFYSWCQYSPTVTIYLILWSWPSFLLVPMEIMFTIILCLQKVFLSLLLVSGLSWRRTQSFFCHQCFCSNTQSIQELLCYREVSRRAVFLGGFCASNNWVTVMAYHGASLMSSGPYTIP